MGAEEPHGSRRPPATLLDELPRWRLARLLRGAGVSTLLSRLRLKWRRLRLQEVTVRLLRGEAGIRIEGGTGARLLEADELTGLRLAAPGGDKSFDAQASMEPPYDISADDIDVEPRRPIIAVDLSLLPMHRHPRELRSLRRQLICTLGVVRRYLWDAHLLLAPVGAETITWLQQGMRLDRVWLSGTGCAETLRSHGYRRIILLDPDAPRDLSADDVLEADAFIIGGIVDLTPVKGATRSIPGVEGVERRRISLRGSIIGVPNRINIIASIILTARYVTLGDVEEAVRRNMCPRDARLRAAVEIARRARSGMVDWSLYMELRKWLPLTEKDFLRAARMAGVTVTGEKP
ncbi:MAG: hypothetical protein GXO09_00480 [Crenarchaeota archaeon]|nr:hypothetical protein [Thermoproteota archaeon]